MRLRCPVNDDTSVAAAIVVTVVITVIVVVTVIVSIVDATFMNTTGLVTVWPMNKS